MGTKWDLDGRVALISGGSRGIGAACAEAMVEAGARVIAVARNQGDLDRLRDRLGSAVEDVGRGCQRAAVSPSARTT